MPYRPIHESEVPIVADIQARSFRFPPERYLEAYNGSGRFDWRALRLFENQQGQPVAALNVFHRPVSLNGGEVDAGLVASVAVPPDLRRRGYARRMMAGLLAELHGQETPISLLFPFSVAFYRSLGYGLANFNWYIELPPRLLPDYPDRMAVRLAGPDDEPAVRACYDRARRLPQNNGWLARGNWEWQHRVVKPEYERVVYPAGGEVEGYLICKLAIEDNFVVGKVVEWVWTSDRAWRGLAGFLAALGEQARSVTYNAPQGSPLLLSLPEPYDRSRPSADFVFFPIARLVNGFMLRVVHAPAALAARRYPVTARLEFILHLDDPQLPANNGPWQVRIADGAASVETAKASDLGATVGTNIATLSQLYAGLMSAEQARTLGHLDADDATCAALTAAFAAAPWTMQQADWF